MACGSCSKDGSTSAAGCGKNGSCLNGGCNRLNTMDWLSMMDIPDPAAYPYHEVSFKNGATKGFFINSDRLDVHSGNWVVVETGNGRDVGVINLSGEIARLQIRKKKVKEDQITNKILRIASQRDIEKMYEAREIEKKSLVQARAIVRSFDLDMKLGDIQYQADLRKATFYYTADGRIDFRNLVRAFAKEFRVKVEMRQIGARQESSRIGGIGSCGRELCCSTWLTEFKSVTTTAARYQNLAINQSKLSGQCGRLKCCLNYELETYMEALLEFPKKVDKLKLKDGFATLIKMDIFKGLMFYGKVINGVRGMVIPVDKEEVKRIKSLNDQGIYPEDLKAYVPTKIEVPGEEEIEFESADLTGVIDLPDEKRRRKKRRNKRSSSRSGRTGDKKGGTQNRQKKTSGNAQKGAQKPSKPGDKSNDKGNARNKPNNTNKKKRFNKKKTGDRNKNRPNNKNKENSNTDKPNNKP